MLGHNGAGKSTLISILSGIDIPTSGNCTIYGHDLITEINEIRNFISVCPQESVFFKDFSVEENLTLFGLLKKVEPEELKFEINSLLVNLGLMDNINTKICDLSGGQERKLMVSLALLGDNKVIILDEPSKYIHKPYFSGVDPNSRNLIWSTIQAYKRNRIIILSTHFMEEADFLGDRIGILSHGKLLSCGRNQFLKNGFGNGYNLTLSKGCGFNYTKLDELIFKHVYINSIVDKQKRIA